MASMGTVSGLATRSRRYSRRQGSETRDRGSRRIRARDRVAGDARACVVAKFAVVITNVVERVRCGRHRDRAPFGAAVSFTSVTAFAVVLPAASVSVRERPGAAAAEADQLKVPEVKLGNVVGVSFACVQMPLREGVVDRERGGLGIRKWIGEC